MINTGMSVKSEIHSKHPNTHTDIFFFNISVGFQRDGNMPSEYSAGNIGTPPSFIIFI